MLIDLATFTLLSNAIITYLLVVKKRKCYVPGSTATMYNRFCVCSYALVELLIGNVSTGNLLQIFSKSIVKWAP